MRLATRRRRQRPDAGGHEPDPFASAENLPDILGSHRTYVGLRLGERWQLLGITSASTTPLWEGRLSGSAGALGAAGAENPAMAAALLNDLTGKWAPPAIRDALACRVVPKLSEPSFVLYSADLDAWLTDHGWDPQTWPSGAAAGPPRSRRRGPSWSRGRRGNR
jgi:hypothetical protein